jgi:hypothetical protein
MADDTLVVSSEFDPSGLTQGLDIGSASLEQFEAMVKQVSKALPGLDTQSLFKIAAQGAKQATAAVRELDAAMKSVGGGGGGGLPPFLGPEAPPRIIRDKVAELKLLAGQLQQSSASANEFAASTRGMNMALLASSASYSRAAAGVRDWDRGMANIRASQQQTGAAFGEMTRATGLARTAFTLVAAETLGTSSAISRLGVSALFLAGAATKVSLAIGGILLLVKVYEQLTKATRAAREEQDKLIKGAQQRTQAALVTGGAERVAALERAKKLEEEIARLSKDRTIHESFIAAKIRERVDLLVLAARLEAEIAAEAARTAQAQREFLAQVAAGNAAVQKTLLATEQQLASFRQAQAALGPQTFGAQPGTISDQETRAFRERVVLARQVATIEIDALQAQLQVASQMAQFTEDEKAARNAKIVEFTQAMAIRRLELDQQVTAIKQEEALLALTRQRALELEAHLRRVAAAGGGNRPQGAGGAAAAAGGVPLFQQRARAQGLMSNLRGQAGEFAKLVALIKLAKAEARLYAEALKAARTQGERIADSLGDIGTAAFGIADVGRSLGLIGEEAARSLEDVGSLADALAQVAVSASTANIFGAITAGAGLLSGLFGSTENERLLAENNKKLADLKASLDESLGGASALVIAAKQLEALGSVPLIVRHGLQMPDPSEMARILEEAGLTVEEWAARIEQITGLDVLNEKGQIVAATLEQANRAIEEMVAAALVFSDTLDIFEQRMRVEEKLGIVPSRTGLERQREVLLEGLDLGPLLEGQAAAFDLETTEGRAAFKEWLKTIYAMAAAGEIAAEELGKFENVDEVLNEIEEAADALAEAEEAAAEAIAEAAAEAEAALQRFADAFPSLLELRRQLMGEGGDAAAQFSDAVSALAFAAPDLAQLFTGFDLNDPAAREGLRALLLDYVNQMLSGQAAVEAMGLTPETFQIFMDFLNQGADILDSFNESVQDATRSILNAPKGFNLAAFEFAAQPAGGPYQWPMDGGGRRGTDGAALPVDAILTRTNQTIADLAEALESGTLSTNLAKFADALAALGRGDPEKLRRLVDQALSRRQMQRDGTPDWQRRR